jgi:diacylglycerol kinase (ATP)
MRKAALLYNPLAGGRQERRRKDIEAAVAVLRENGVDTIAEPTRAASDSTTQTLQAVKQGCDTVFACGGDGTIHDILQGLVGTNAALGIIPLGTANVVAHDLAIPRSPGDAARFALSAQPRRIAVGKIEYTDLSGKNRERFFLAVLGIGADAHIFYKLNPTMKNRLGLGAYYVKATHLWLTHDMGSFAVEFTNEDGEKNFADVSQLLAVRIRNFGGVLREFAPGAALDRKDLRLVLFRTRSRIAYLRYITRSLLGTKWAVKGIEYAYAISVKCRPLESSSKIFVEADGELLGMLPAKISIVPDAVTLLMPTPRT